MSVHSCSLQLIHKGNSACEGNESNSSENYIDNTVEKKVGKNENIELEIDDDNDFYPISNLPSNISSNDDVEDLTSSLIDLSIQSCNDEKGWKNLEEDVLIADSSDNVEILEAKQAELHIK